jgi:uncharacterized protein YbjT (DUF2867 family)
VAVFSESVEKHDRNVYELGGETLSNEERAAIFSKMLGKSITYEQQSMEDYYKAFMGFGMPHSFAYSLLSSFSTLDGHPATPQIAILIGRPLHTLEEWLKENVKAFQ